MKVNWKNLSLVILIVIILSGLGVGTYWYFNQNKSEGNSNNEQSNDSENKDSLKTIPPSGNYTKYTSKELSGISFEYPDNWILDYNNGNVVIRNTDNSFEIELTKEATFGEIDPPWLKIQKGEFPTKDSNGNEIIISKIVHTKIENILSLEQETDETIITYIPFGNTISIIKITANPKNSKYIDQYVHLVDSINTNVTNHTGI